MGIKVNKNSHKFSAAVSDVRLLNRKHCGLFGLLGVRVRSCGKDYAKLQDSKDTTKVANTFNGCLVFAVCLESTNFN